MTRCWVEIPGLGRDPGRNDRISGARLAAGDTAMSCYSALQPIRVVPPLPVHRALDAASWERCRMRRMPVWLACQIDPASTSSAVSDPDP